jgi:predicted RND superfamily exporter protein
LDDSFIMTGSFYRTDPKKSILDRIEEMMEDVGISITITTLTSALAFALGCTSSIPSVYWLCAYAFPTILIDFLYQITFFVAVIVLDEKRIQENRRDICVCFTVKNSEQEEGVQRVQQEGEEQEGEEQGGEETGDDDHGAEEVPEESKVDQFMVWYAEHLLKPWVKAFVLLLFAGLFAGCAFSTSKLTQEFDFTDVVPDDSVSILYLTTLRIIVVVEKKKCSWFYCCFCRVTVHHRLLGCI